MANTVFARALADAIQGAHKDCKNKPLIQQLFYLLNARSIFVIFLCNWTQCFEGFSSYNEGMLEKVKMQRTQLLFVTERTQLTAAHAQLLEKLRLVDF